MRVRSYRLERQENKSKSLSLFRRRHGCAVQEEEARKENICCFDSSTPPLSPRATNGDNPMEKQNGEPSTAFRNCLKREL
jgi:hypothetical protein